MKFGYARISRSLQNLDLQKDALRQCRQINLPHNTMQRICTAARNDLVFLA
jgi:DNA invertase Pin-like site-specific DNA recombinase